MIEVETEKKIHSEHIVTDHDFHNHDISVNCSCNPDRFAGTNVFQHQLIAKNESNSPAIYRTYLLFDDNTFDLKVKNKKR